MTTIQRAGHQAIAAAALLALGCGGDEGLIDNGLGDYTLAVTPAALSIVGGASSSATVAITRTNFAGDVALALLNPPAGITGTFTPTPTTTNTSALVVSVAATAAAGSHVLTIQGTATGPGVKTTTLTVTVPAPPAGGNVQYRFCDSDDVPVFLAYQDGTAPWQAVTGVTSGGSTRFTFTIAQGRGGVMSVFPVSPGYQTYLVYGSTPELVQDGLDACPPEEATKTVTGTVANVPAGSYGIVTLGASTKVFDGAVTSNPVTFSEVQVGPVDLVGSLTTPGNLPTRMIAFRNLNVPDGGSLPSVVDFNGPASFAPATATAIITGSAGDNLEIFVDLVTATARAQLWFDLAPSPATSRPWAGFGPANMVSGDFHGLVVFASPANGPDDVRVALKYVGPVGNETLALGPKISAPATTPVAAGPYPRFRFQGTRPAEYNKGINLDLLSTSGSGSTFSIFVTGAWLAASGSTLAYDITMPDVTGLAGFPVASRLTAGTNDVATSQFGFTGTGIADLRPSLGAEFKAASKGSTINVP